MNLMTSDDYQLLGDSKYRAYVGQVEKALKGFEYTNEWADLISALTKLNKILASHKYAIIPKRMTIGKRLAQCMHPALPAGVHLKAIEVYETVFKLIGNDKLADELYVYSSGLFPLMANAASNVRPALLKIYEMYFLPLGDRLRSATTGLLLGILPGLEEGSESYQWSSDLLEQLSVAVGQVHFYGSLWTCLLTSHAVRLPGTAFLLAHYDRKCSLDDQLHLMGSSVETVVRALQECVQDSQVLVQRNALDFAALAFPFHGKHLPKADQKRLLAASLNALMRRDMSLNRRLFSWMLGDHSTGTDIVSNIKGGGHDEGTKVALDYLAAHSRTALVEVLNEIILAPPGDTFSADGVYLPRAITPEPSAAVPIRILISLLDKQEIGSLVLEDVLVSVFRLLRSSYCQLSSRAGEDHSSTSRSGFYAHALRLTQVIDTIRARCPMIGRSSITLASSALPSRRPSPSTPCTLPSHQPQQLQSPPHMSKDASADIIKSVTLLLGNIETGFLWSFVSDLLCRQLRHSWVPPPLSESGSSPSLVSSSITGSLSFVEACELVEVVLHVLCPEGGGRSGSNIATHSQHVSVLLRDVLVTVEETCTTASGLGTRPSLAQLQELHAALQLCSNLLATTVPTLPLGGAAFVDSHSSIDSCFTDQQCETGGKRPSADTRSRPSDLGLMSQCTAIYLDLFPMIVSMCCTGYQEPERMTYRAACDPQQPKIFCGSSETYLQADVAMLACKLLVDFSSIPLYCSSVQKALLTSTSVGSDPAEESAYPNWLLWLLMLVFRCDQFSISSVALCSLLDLGCLAHLATEQLAIGDTVELSRGYHRHLDSTGNCVSSSSPSASVRVAGSAEPGPATTEVGRVFILLWPALTPALYKRLFGDGFLYGQITRLVWARIGPSVPEAFQTSISCDILNHLLQLVPNEAIVEDVIASSLVCLDLAQKIDAYEKLFSFWHCTHSLGKIGARSLKRPLLIALMAMTSEDDAVRMLVRNWLMHVLEEDGGILLLMEPLLIALLQPDTARVEIRRLEVIGGNANEVQPENTLQMFGEQASAALDERRIYAISHEGGSVKYHVMDLKTASQRFPHATQAVVKSAVTAVDKDGITTSKSSLSPEASFQHIRPDSVKLHLNPFGSESSLDKLIFDGFRPHASIHSSSGYKEMKPEASASMVEEKPSYDEIIARAKRLDSETCKREGITFGLEDDDDFDNYDSCPSSVPADVAVTLAKSIVEDVLTTVFDAVDRRSLPSSPLTRSSETSRSCSRHSSVATDSADGISSSCPATPATIAAATWIPGPPASPKRMSGASRNEPAAAVVDSTKPLAGPPNQATVTYGYGSKPGTRSVDVTAPMMLGAERLVQSLPIALYTQAYDSSRVLCALTCIKSVLAVSPQLVLHALASHSIGSLPRAAELVTELMQRHRRCLSGGRAASGFYAACPIVGAEAAAAVGIGETTLVEAVAGLAATFARSYYTELRPQASGLDEEGVEVDCVRRRWPAALPRVSAADAECNAVVQAAALDVLYQVITQSVGCFGGLSAPSAAVPPRDLTMLRVSELIAKEHLHWVVLGLAHSFAFWTAEHWARLGITWEPAEQLVVHCRTVQLAAAIVAFERCAAKCRQEPTGGSGRPLSAGHGRLRLCEREAFSRCLASALEGCAGGQHAWRVQLAWLQMAVGCLPHFGSSLPAVVTEVVNRLCISIDSLLEPAWSSSAARRQPGVSSGQAIAGGGNSAAPPPPPGHVARLLRLFAALIHFTLAECSSQSLSLAALAESTPDPPAAAAATTAGGVGGGGGGSSLIGSGLASTHLITVLDPMGAMALERSGNSRFGEVEASSAASQKPILDLLPRIVTTMYRLWAATATVNTTEDTAPEQLHVGRQELRTQILGLLSPVAAGGCVKQLLAAMVQVWNELRASGSFLKKLSQELVVVTVDQSTFIDLLMSIKVLHCDALVDSVCKLLKVIAAESDFPKAGTADCDSKWMLYAGAVHLLLCYAHKLSPMSASNVTSLCTFVREVLQLSPPPVGVLLLLRLLATVVRKLTVAAGDSDRRMLKELQEVTQKLVDACCTIVASQLEPTAWLQTRKNYSVKAPTSRQHHSVAGHSDSDDDDDVGATAAGPSSSATLLIQPSAVAGSLDSGLPSDSARLAVVGSLEQYSVLALEHLAEILASLLDVVYPSEDKDKAVPVLVSVFHHALPYLRNHSAHNVPSYRACSQLLASVSSYGYTRRAWRRDALELLLAPEFFQMDRKSLAHWRVLTDHLMTQDKQAFKDLLARLTLSGAAALPLFGGGVKDQEFELRGQYMKRLAFVIFCSDIDQYKHNLPEIQERLAECLRLPHVPSLQAQVFLCLRVLLMRVSSQHLTALWPTIVTELVQVLLQIEQELSTDAEDSRLPSAGSSAQVSRLVALDISWAHGNGLHAHSNPAWLQLYVSACRLLDLLCYLPDDRIPEFHHYQWMFISAGIDSGRSNRVDKGFVPHAARIERHMHELFGPCSTAASGGGSSKGLLLADAPVSSLRDLHPVFYALANQALSRPQSPPRLLAQAERYMETDFLEAIPQ